MLENLHQKYYISNPKIARTLESTRRVVTSAMCQKDTSCCLATYRSKTRAHLMSTRVIIILHFIQRYLSVPPLYIDYQTNARCIVLVLLHPATR